MRKAEKLIFTLLLIILPCLGLNAQTRQFVGKITDATDGSPLTGVCIINENSRTSALSDMDGHYEIRASDGDRLSFTFLGFRSEYLTVSPEQKTYDLVMSVDSKVLDDVIVVAYGTSAKESFTGSAQTVKADRLQDRPVTDVSKMLDGQMSGVMTTSGSGQPGSGSDIIIRGFGSINASSSPLIVLDGIPFDGSLNSINSADIESVSVLKDASAGALYGARGANGVVIITTKTGSDDKINVSLSAKVGFNSRAIPAYETMDAKQYLEHIYSACRNDLVYVEGLVPSQASALAPSEVASTVMGTGEKYNIYDIPSSQLFDANGKIVSNAKMRYNENWMDEAEASCPIRQEYQIGVNGGGAKAKYIASFSYLNDQGTLKTTSFTRYTARVGGDFTPKKWLKIGANINYAHSNSAYLGSTGTQSNNVWYSAMKMAPIYPVYEKNEDGSTVYENGSPKFDYGVSRPAGAQNSRNCVATLFDDEYCTVADNVGLRSYAGVNFAGFDFTTNFGADMISTCESTNLNRKYGDAALTGRLTKENLKELSYTWNQILSYKGEFGLAHKLDVMLGHEFYNYNLSYLTAQRTGFSFDNYDELALGTNIVDGNSAGDNYRIDSYFTRVNYSYADRYYFSASFRMDGSSRFEASNRWGAFWSLGASWRISEEKFLSKADWMDNLTIKASYGVQGNDNIGSYYAWQSLYSLNYPNASRSAGIIESLENKSVTWEKNGNLNTGIEFRLFHAFSGSIEYYNRLTTDLLLSYPMAISTGFESYYANAGSMVNQGVDMNFGYDIFNTKDTYWNVTLIGSTISNKVLSLTGNGEDIISGNTIIREGEELNSFYLAKSAGVDPTTGTQLYWAYKKDDAGKMIPGSEYVTSDATAASSSKYLFGSRNPDFYGSISTNAKFFGFDLSVLCTYSIGGNIYDSVYASLMEPSYAGQSYHVNALRSWSKPGDVTDVPRASLSLSSVQCDRFLVDASYFCIKNISFGYSLPSRILSKAKIDTVRFFVSCEGVWTFTALKGLNPQANLTGTTSYTYTPARTATLGIDFKF